MPVTDSQFKFMLIGAIFITLFALFNALFIGGQLAEMKAPSFTDFLKVSWGVLTQPELLPVNIVLGTISTIGGVIILASYIRG